MCVCIVHLIFSIHLSIITIICLNYTADYKPFVKSVSKCLFDLRLINYNFIYYSFYKDFESFDTDSEQVRNSVSRNDLSGVSEIAPSVVSVSSFLGNQLLPPSIIDLSVVSYIYIF